MGSYFRDYFSPKASERPTVGDTKFSVVNMDHMGWLKCDGRWVSVNNYNILFQAIGYKFGGVGNFFALPDMQGRVPGGIGAGAGLTPRNLGTITGTEEETLTISQMPAHTHGSSNVTGNTNGNGYTTSNGDHFHTGTTSNDGSHSHTQTTINDDFNNNSGNYGGDYTRPSYPASDGGGTITWTGTINSNGSHTHAFTTSNAGAHNHQIFNTGGDQPHNNMQPTLFIGNLFIYSGKQSFTAGSYPYTSPYPAAIGNILL